MYQAYASGRINVHLADPWFDDKLFFLDFYVVCLSKKLCNCGVYGMLSKDI